MIDPRSRPFLSLLMIQLTDMSHDNDKTVLTCSLGILLLTKGTKMIEFNKLPDEKGTVEWKQLRLDSGVINGSNYGWNEC